MNILNTDSICHSATCLPLPVTHYDNIQLCKLSRRATTLLNKPMFTCTKRTQLWYNQTISAPNKYITMITVVESTTLLTFRDNRSIFSAQTSIVSHVVYSSASKEKWRARIHSGAAVIRSPLTKKLVPQQIQNLHQLNCIAGVLIYQVLHSHRNKTIFNNLFSRVAANHWFTIYKSFTGSPTSALLYRIITTLFCRVRDATIDAVHPI